MKGMKVIILSVLLTIVVIGHIVLSVLHRNTNDITLHGRDDDRV
jgi:hypothetical protein